MDDYKKIPFDDPDLCVPDLDDFDQMKEFFLDCAAEYFRYLSSDDMEKMLAALAAKVIPYAENKAQPAPDRSLGHKHEVNRDAAQRIQASRENAVSMIDDHAIHA